MVRQCYFIKPVFLPDGPLFHCFLADNIEELFNLLLKVFSPLKGQSYKLLL